jgi:hypothetical protein
MSPIDQWNVFLSVVILIYMVVALLCFLIQRKEFPVAQRFPYVVMFELALIGLGGILNTLIHVSAFADSVSLNCQTFDLFELVLGYASIATLVVRTQFQLMKDFSTKLLVQQSNADEYTEETSKDLKISRKDGILFKSYYSLLALEMKYFNNWSASLLHVIPIVIAAVIVLVNISVTKEFSMFPAGSSECINFVPSVIPTYVGNIVYGYFILSAVPVFVLFQRMKDSIYLLLELRMLVSFFIFQLFLLVFQGNTELWKWIDGLLTLGTMSIPFFPVVISFRLQKAKNKSNKTELSATSSIGEVIEELKTVINTPELRQLFLKHLEMEYSVENLAFYESCVSLEIMVGNSRNNAEILDKVRFIRKTFLDTFAISCVNISHPNRLKALDVLGKDEELALISQQSILDVLKDPKEEILKLMATDSFGRFKRSDIYVQEKAQGKKSSLFNRSLNTISSFGKSASRHEELETTLEILSPVKE